MKGQKLCFKNCAFDMEVKNNNGDVDYVLAVCLNKRNRIFDLVNRYHQNC